MKLKKSYRITIKEKRWKIKFRRHPRKHKYPGKGNIGRCVWHKRTIYIDARLKPRLLLDTVLHEIRHAHFRWLDEDYVNDYSTEEAKILQKLGYKRG